VKRSRISKEKIEDSDGELLPMQESSPAEDLPPLPTDPIVFPNGVDNAVCHLSFFQALVWNF
jgi:hypothetical protein